MRMLIVIRTSLTKESRTLEDGINRSQNGASTTNLPQNSNIGNSNNQSSISYRDYHNRPLIDAITK